MDLPTTNIAELLKKRDITVERVSLNSRRMRDHLFERLRRHETWQIAIVQQGHGMILLRKSANERIEGLYYPEANCGTAQPCVVYTADMLRYLGVGGKTDDIVNKYLKQCPHVIVKGLDSRTPPVPRAVK